MTLHYSNTLKGCVFTTPAATGRRGSKQSAAAPYLAPTWRARRALRRRPGPAGPWRGERSDRNRGTGRGPREKRESQGLTTPWPNGSVGGRRPASPGAAGGQAAAAEQEERARDWFGLGKGSGGGWYGWVRRLGRRRSGGARGGLLLGALRWGQGRGMVVTASAASARRCMAIGCHCPTRRLPAPSDYSQRNAVDQVSFSCPFLFRACAALRLPSLVWNNGGLISSERGR